MGRKRPLKFGDLVEISTSGTSPAYIARLNSDGSLEASYIPVSIIGVWLGKEFVDLGVDKVELESFLHEGQKHVLISGNLKKVR